MRFHDVSKRATSIACIWQLTGHADAAVLREVNMVLLRKDFHLCVEPLLIRDCARDMLRSIYSLLKDSVGDGMQIPANPALQGGRSTCGGVRPVKENMPIWLTTWSQPPGAPAALRLSSSFWRMLMMRSAMPFSSTCAVAVDGAQEATTA